MSASTFDCAHKLLHPFGVVGVFINTMFVPCVTKRHEIKHRFICSRSVTRTANSGDGCNE